MFERGCNGVLESTPGCDGALEIVPLAFSGGWKIGAVSPAFSTEFAYIDRRVCFRVPSLKEFGFLERLEEGVEVKRLRDDMDDGVETERL